MKPYGSRRTRGNYCGPHDVEKCSICGDEKASRARIKRYGRLVEKEAEEEDDPLSGCDQTSD